MAGETSGKDKESMIRKTVKEIVEGEVAHVSIMD